MGNIAGWGHNLQITLVDYEPGEYEPLNPHPPLLYHPQLIFWAQRQHLYSSHISEDMTWVTSQLLNFVSIHCISQPRNFFFIRLHGFYDDHHHRHAPLDRLPISSYPHPPSLTSTDPLNFSLGPARHQTNSWPCKPSHLRQVAIMANCNNRCI